MNFAGVVWFRVAVIVALTWLAFSLGLFRGDPSVHQKMAQILNEEVPADVTYVALDAPGARQNCLLSNGQQEVALDVPNLSPSVHIQGEFERDGGVWRSHGLQASAWVTDVWSKKWLNDGQAISAPDFRSLVRQCVRAVRQKQHQPSALNSMPEGNRASWSVAQ